MISSPSQSTTSTSFDSDKQLHELDEGQDAQKPTLSVPIEDNDESFQSPPQLLSEFDDETPSMKSIEGPRRYVADLGRAPHSDLRISNRFDFVSDISSDEDSSLYSRSLDLFNERRGDEQLNTGG